MSALSVYTQAYDLLDAHLDERVDTASRERIALLVVGIIGAKSASPSRIVDALSQSGLSNAKPESIERRVRRIENDAERAFGTPMFCDMITARGWHFVVRVQGQTRHLEVSGKSQRIDSLVTRRGQRAKFRGRAFKTDQWRDVSVVVYWGTRHQTPLFLVTSHPPKWRIILLYRRRFPIEALFRDYKSYGCQSEQGQVTDLEHLERLLVGMALATWVTIYVGTQVAAHHRSQPPTGRRRTVPWIAKRSLFRLGLSFVHQMFNDPTDYLLQWELLDWSAGHWQQQIYFHHAKAYVFANR